MERAYEFAIGSWGNNKTELYKAGFDTAKASQDTRFILDEDTMVEFWIKWITVEGSVFLFLVCVCCHLRPGGCHSRLDLISTFQNCPHCTWEKVPE